LLKRSPNFVEKYHFIAELLIVEYRLQNISVAKMELYKQTTKSLCTFA